MVDSSRISSSHEASCSLLGSSPFSRRYATSRKEHSLPSCSIGYPLYLRKPALPSNSVIPLWAPEVFPKEASSNHIPGSSFDHSAESTPFLSMGISIDSPVLLSVILMLSDTFIFNLSSVPIYQA